MRHLEACPPAVTAIYFNFRDVQPKKHSFYRLVFGWYISLADGRRASDRPFWRDVMSSVAPGAFKGPTFTLALAGIAIAAVSGLRSALKGRIEVSRLADLDDRALKDIGLMRTDVYAALAMPIHRDPSDHLIEVAGHKRPVGGGRPPMPAPAPAAGRAPAMKAPSGAQAAAF